MIEVMLRIGSEKNKERKLPEFHNSHFTYLPSFPVLKTQFTCFCACAIFPRYGHNSQRTIRIFSYPDSAFLLSVSKVALKVKLQGPGSQTNITNV
jgi:hypothetical protein